MTIEPTYPDYHKIWVYLNGVRTNITHDVIEDITGGGWGVMSNKATDKVGETGHLEFSLNDIDGIYTPNSINALSGWDKGVVVELEIFFDRVSYLFKFYIAQITPPSSSGEIKTYVKCVDWMDHAHGDPIENPSVMSNKTGDQVLNTALTLMPFQPADTNFDVGVNVFPTVFDTNTPSTTIYDEIVKVTFSELSYSYLIKDQLYGETLRFENVTARNGLRTLSKIPLFIPGSPLTKIVKKDGGYLLLMSGGKINLAKQTPPTEDAIIDEHIINPEASYGDSQINRMVINANPRRLDSTEQILFKLDTPIPILSGQTITIEGTYADPAGGGSINAQGMLTPAITTDYLVNVQEDGGGANISANLLLISTPYGTEGFIHTVKNNGPTSGYIIKYNCRGIGIYNYNPIHTTKKSQPSIDKYGTFSETIDQRYKNTLERAEAYALNTIDNDGNPEMVMNKLLLCANASPRLMMAFLNLHPGDLVQLTINKYNIDSKYYIQGIDDFSISTGGIIMFKWVVSRMWSL